MSTLFGKLLIAYFLPRLIVIVLSIIAGCIWHATVGLGLLLLGFGVILIIGHSSNKG